MTTSASTTPTPSSPLVAKKCRPDDDRIIRSFLIALEAENASPGTRELYGSAVRRFQDWWIRYAEFDGNAAVMHQLPGVDGWFICSLGATKANSADPNNHDAGRRCDTKLEAQGVFESEAAALLQLRGTVTLMPIDDPADGSRLMAPSCPS